MGAAASVVAIHFAPPFLHDLMMTSGELHRSKKSRVVDFGLFLVAVVVVVAMVAVVEEAM